MKIRNLLLVCLVLLVSTLNINGQTVLTKTDSLPLGQDTLINFVLNKARGNIQWQKSLDSKSWIDLKGETKDTLIIKPDVEALYRAIVSDGLCLPVVSDTVGIITSDSISKSYVDSEKMNLTLVSDSMDISNGNYIYIGVDSVYELEVGKVIVDEQSGGTIRRITELSQNTDTIKAKTEQATMEDLFLEDSFNLSTEMIYPSGDLKSISSVQLEKLLTDEEGFIHPVEVIDLLSDGTVLKSTSIFSESKNTAGSLYLHIDWADFPLFEYSGSFSVEDTSGTSSNLEGNIKAYISEGYFTFDPTLKFEFAFSKPKIRIWPPKVNIGKIKKFKFYADKSKTDFKNILVFESDIKYELKKEITLKENAVKKKIKFLVQGVPVWIDVNVDIKSDITVVVEGESVIQQGFQNTNFITLGAGYEYSSWSIIKDFDTENNFFITNQGYVHSGIRFDIYPDVDIKLYSLAGPEFKIGPYLKYDVYKSFSGNWDKSFDLGMDASVGASVKILGKSIASLPETTWNIFNKNLWSAPVNLTVESGDGQTAPLNNELPEPVIVKVTSSSSEPIPNVQVYFEAARGTVSVYKVKTNNDGFAQTKWTLSGGYGEHLMKVYLLNGKDEKIDSISVLATAVSPFSPDVTTSNITDTTQTSAVTGGNVTNSGSDVISRGVCWNKTGNPSIENDHTEDGTGKGNFTSLITGLDPGTEYYVRAYATNLAGTSYGDQKIFETKLYNNFTDSRDGKTYRTILINGQEWMAENLAYLPVINSPTGGSINDPYYYVYDYSGNSVEEAKTLDNYHVYGVLYNYSAALESCPSGWHLPTNEEWTAMENYLIENGFNYDGTTTGNKIAKSLAAVDYWYESNTTGAVGNMEDYPESFNKTGFSGLPGGLFNYPNKKFGEKTLIGFWWSSTEESDIYTWNRQIKYNISSVDRFGQSREHGFSVRCVKDK